MKRTNLFQVLLLLTFMLSGCSGDECSPQHNNDFDESIMGNWFWVKSVGGIAGSIITPSSEGYTLEVRLNELYYTQLKIDIIELNRQYDFEVRSDSFLGDNKYLVHENEFQFTYDFNKDTLILTEGVMIVLNTRI